MSVNIQIHLLDKYISVISGNIQIYVLERMSEEIPPLRELSAEELKNIKPKDKLWHEYGDSTYAVQVKRVHKSSIEIRYLVDGTKATLKKTSESFLHGLLCEDHGSDGESEAEVTPDSQDLAENEKNGHVLFV